jgi:hypothetical protein
MEEDLGFFRLRTSEVSVLERRAPHALRSTAMNAEDESPASAANPL